MIFKKAMSNWDGYYKGKTKRKLQVWGVWRKYIPCGKVQHAGTVENSLMASEKIKYSIIIPRNSTFGYTPKGVESGDSNRYLYTHGHSSIINSGQKVETTKLSFHR